MVAPHIGVVCQEERPPVRAVSWLLTAADPDGAPMPAGNLKPRSVQVEGEFGAGQVVLQGSNSGVRYEDLVLFRYAGIEPVSLEVGYLAPRLLHGDAQTTVTVTVIGGRV